MASNSQEIPTTKRNKRKAMTLENYYKEKIQSTEETGEEDKYATMPKPPPPQNKKWSQAFKEFQSELMRKVEEIWQEKWETVKKENNSIKGRISQLETEAQKSNEMINKLKTRNDQPEAMKSHIDQTEKENQKIIAENQSLKTRIGQLEANDLIR